MALGTGLSSWGGGGGVNRTQSNPYTSAPVPFKTPFQKDQDTYRSIENLVGSQYGGEYQGLYGQLNTGRARQGFNNTWNQQQQGYAQNDYNLNMRGNALDSQNIGLQRESLGIDAGGAQRDTAYYQNLLGMMPQYRGLANDSYQNTLQKLILAGETERRGINSDATGRGAWFAPMRGANIADSTRSQELGSQAAGTAYQGDLMGLQEKELGLGRNFGGAQDSQAKIAIAQRGLDIDAQRLGITADRYKADLQKGLDQLGYQNFMSLEDLYALENSTDAKSKQLAAQIKQQAYEIAKGSMGSQYQQFFPQGG